MECLAQGLRLNPTRLWKLFSAFGSPNSEWLQTGGLVSRGPIPNVHALGHVARQLKSLDGSFVVLDWLDGSNELDVLQVELERIGCHVFRQLHLRTGVVNLDDTFECYFASLSKGVRKKIRSNQRKLEELGAVEFEVQNSFRDRAEFERSFQEVCRIEDLGWKGEQGTSLARNPEIRDLYLDVLFELSTNDHVEFHFLWCGDKRIAFDVVLKAKQTRFSYKISYDPKYARFGPGQLLMSEQMQHWYNNDNVDRVDTVGEVTKATAKWCNEIVDRHRLIVATNPVAACMLKAYRKAKPLAQRILRRSSRD